MGLKRSSDALMKFVLTFTHFLLQNNRQQIVDFDTEAEVDFVEITIGGRTLSQMDSPALARLSGQIGPTSYYSYNNHMTVTFSSDSANHGNFEIRLNSGNSLRLHSHRAKAKRLFRLSIVHNPTHYGYP